MTSLLGIDIGGTKSAILLGDSSGQVLARREWPSHAARGPEPMLADLLAHARALLAETGLRPQSAGVSIGGPLDAEKGIIYSPPNLPGWDALPLKDRLQVELGLPVNVEHDAAACALAETLWGAGQGRARVIYLTCGTGFGAGLVLEGRIYRGAGGRSPEVGHWRYSAEGPEAFGKPGSAEAWCSGSGLGKLAAWKYPARWSENPPTGAELHQLSQAGDAQARDILRLNATATGHIAAKLADLFRPDRVILGSLARYLGAPWLEDVRAAFAKEALPDESSEIIVPSGLGERLQDCSALAAALGG
jgi:glucokinase